MKRFLKGSLPLALAVIAVTVGMAEAQMFRTRNPYMPDYTFLRFAIIAGAGLLGFGLGWFASPQAAKLRLAIAVIALGLVAFFTVFENGVIGWSLTPFVALATFAAGLMYWLAQAARRLFRLPTTYGDAKWADIGSMEAAGLFDQEKGIRLGWVQDGETKRQIIYSGIGHLITVARTRWGKGTTSIIANLLRYTGSTVVIDVKGENALMTAKYRRDVLGQKVYILDGFDTTANSGLPTARFNPMDALDPTDIDFPEKTILMADSLILPSSSDQKFWDESGKALLQGPIGYVASDESEAGQRNLGRVRDLFMGDADELRALGKRMMESPHHFIASSGARLLQMDEKLLSNVLASVQAQTTFLDSPRMRDLMSSSDFSFADLKEKKISLYLVLPADRMHTFSRWLRLMIQQAIRENARNIEVQPEEPILFILDEMPILGHMQAVEEAFGLMAGYSMQLWGICQDANQLRMLYKDGWETFVSNASVLQYFGTRDRTTAEYFSALCGETTVWNFSTAISRALGHSYGNGGSSSSSSTSETETASAISRKLVYPDQLMRMPKDSQLLLIENLDPIRANRTPWFEDPELKDRGVNLHAKKPADTPEA